ncbi:MAG: hypothetical protein ACLU9S_15630 [Oscillospiraceae bacterium]
MRVWRFPRSAATVGGTVRLVPASMVYGAAAAKRLKLESEKFYQCQNCNARVGCHKGYDTSAGQPRQRDTAAQAHGDPSGVRRFLEKRRE